MGRAVHLPVNRIQEISANVKVLSIDKPAYDKSNPDTWLDRIPDERATPPGQHAAAERLKAHVRELVATLPSREAEVVRLYYLEEERLTLDEVGQRLGITRQRVLQIKQKGLRRLGHAARGQRVRSVLSGQRMYQAF